MPDSTNSTELHASLLARAQNLLDEVQEFHAFLQSNASEECVETKHFQNNVKSEVKSLSRMKSGETGSNPEDDEQEVRRLHILHSTNLPFYEAVWDAAKQCQGVKALGRRMYLVPKTESEDVSSAVSDPASKIGGQALRKKSVLVDVVARDGLEWVKVSTINPKRILYEIAKEGWEKYANSEDEASDSDISSGNPDLQIVRLAKELRNASLHIRVRYQHPQVRLLLPKIKQGEHADIDAILADLRKTGVLVQTGGCPELNGPEPKTLAITANANFTAMLPHPAEPLTNTLNIDCTILLALISDISHIRPRILKNNKQSYHSAIRGQISAEEASPLLNRFYTMLVGRNLVCTIHAANRACEIVKTMGTPTESLRTALFLGQGDYASTNDEELRSLLRQNSIHSVPDDLRIRIAQIDFGPEDAFQQESLGFPTTIAKLAADSMKMSPINRSVFLYGWHKNVVTVTSNQAVARLLVRSIKCVLDDQERAHPIDLTAELQQEFRGPQIWICETARSLIGKQK